MKTKLVIGAAMLALAACGSSDRSDGNGSAAATGGSGAAAGVNLQPGEWEIKAEVVNIAAEGLPAGMTEGLKAQAGSTSRSCMTPEDAKAPKGDMFTGQQGNCKSEGFSWAGGKIKGKTVCTGTAGGGTTEMEMDGSYGPQNIDMTMKSKTDVAGKAMTMEMRVSGRRVGECSASTKAG